MKYIFQTKKNSRLPLKHWIYVITREKKNGEKANLFSLLFNLNNKLNWKSVHCPRTLDLMGLIDGNETKPPLNFWHSKAQPLYLKLFIWRNMIAIQSDINLYLIVFCSPWTLTHLQRDSHFERCVIYRENEQLLMVFKST